MGNTASSGKPKSVSGAVYIAPKGSTLPTDASTALDAAFKSVGYISDDGLTNAMGLSSEEKKAWGGLVVMSTITEVTDEFKFTMISPQNEEALKLVFGDDNVTVSSGKLTIKKNGKEPVEHAFVFEMIVCGKAKRIVVPQGKLKETGDVTYNDADEVGYEVTIAALADSSDNTHYEYMTT